MNPSTKYEQKVPIDGRAKISGPSQKHHRPKLDVAEASQATRNGKLGSATGVDGPED